ELRAREAVRPGITGLWQVEARDNPSFLAYRRFDLFYIQNWSVALDLMILASTAEALIARVLRMARHATEDIHLGKGRHQPSLPRLEPVGPPSRRPAPHATSRPRRHDRAGRAGPGLPDDDGTPDDGPISVLHVAQSTRYGLQRYLEDLVAAQTRAGWDVTVATAADEPLADTCAGLGAAFRPWDAQRSPGPSVARELVAFGRLVDEVAPDVVHLHSSKAGLVGRLALRGRRPTIFSPHAWSFLHTGRALHGATLAWERRAASWADMVLCVSAAERARGEEAGVHARFRVVPNAVDLERFRAAEPGERERVRQELDLPAGPLAVCIGRLVPQKGQDALVAAWDEVRRHVPDASLVLVGEGQLGSTLDGSGVTLVGASDAVRSWIVAADVVVQPSRWEGMSLTVLEALGCGRSVVATDVEGMREALGDDFPAGAVVPVGDTEGLVAAVVERLTTPGLRACEERLAGDRAARFSVAAWGLMMRALTRDVAAARLPTP
ncbi:MAG TPA: glycosyltransferase, partial [Acidimicrobiia bacterium]|nr:glycosyltransferase [Acidimicrobiia bacterium]